MPYENLLLETAAGVGKITLNRPDSYNPLNQALADELLDALIVCYSNPEVRALLITGSGKAFSAGGDVKAMAEALKADATANLRHLATSLHNVIATMTHMPKPIVAAVNGSTAGAGFALVLASDLAIASDRAKLVTAFTNVALSPDTSTTFFLPRYVGMKTAMDLVLRNRQLTAQEALELGLINEVVPDVELATRADELARTMAAGPTFAFGRAKQLLYRGLGTTLETQMESERESVSDCSVTADFREAVTAFVEKRKPTFIGK